MGTFAVAGIVGLGLQVTTPMAASIEYSNYSSYASLYNEYTSNDNESLPPNFTNLGDADPEDLPEEDETIYNDGGIYMVTDEVNFDVEVLDEDVYASTSGAYNYGEVTYVRPSSRTCSSQDIPDYITVSGYVYQVTAIESDAFSGCRNLRSVSVGANVIEIGDEAFKGCRKLRYIEMNANVGEIGSDTFKGCKSLKKIDISGMATTSTEGDDFFSWTQLAFNTNYRKANRECGDYQSMFSMSGLRNSVKVVG